VETIDFYYGVGSRYSYLAATQIAKLESETSCKVEWQPINSVKLISQRDRSPFQGTPVSGQYEWSYRELDAKRWANLYEVPFFEPRDRVKFDPELLARAVTVAKYFDRVVDYSHLLFTEIFQSSELKTIDEDRCCLYAHRCGISRSDFQAIFNSQANLARLDLTLDRAIALGIFGVPTFVTHSGEIFWGNDRIVLLHHYLRSRASDDR
jgi:2-hydroxychromene-2-carboxylate isomerase